MGGGGEEGREGAQTGRRAGGRAAGLCRWKMGHTVGHVRVPSACVVCR